MTPLISVLLPTRHRTHLMAQSLGGLLALARRPQDIELAVIHDDDDTESRDYFHGSDWQALVQAHGAGYQIHSTPRLGYGRLNEYLNILAPRSRGSWLLFWNDDAVMETANWDDSVRENHDWLGLLHIHCRNVPMRCSIFPLFNRKWLDIFGMVSPNTFSDSWISDVCIEAGARRIVPVTTFHDRFEETGNNQDQTWAERSYANRREYHSDTNRQLRRSWAEKLRAARSQSV